MSRLQTTLKIFKTRFNNGMLMIISSTLQLVLTFVMMVILSPILTVLLIAMVFLMFQIVKKLGVKSGKQFAAQQAILGQVNGFVEEHIEGQKVVKVFNHEHKVLDGFNKLNTELQRSCQ